MLNMDPMTNAQLFGDISQTDIPAPALTCATCGRTFAAGCVCAVDDFPRSAHRGAVIDGRPAMALLHQLLNRAVYRAEVRV